MFSCPIHFQYCGLPISTLIGGCHGDSMELYMTVSSDDTNVMVEKVRMASEEGYRKFQLKVGGMCLYNG